MRVTITVCANKPLINKHQYQRKKIPWQQNRSQESSPLCVALIVCVDTCVCVCAQVKSSITGRPTLPYYAVTLCCDSCTRSSKNRLWLLVVPRDYAAFPSQEHTKINQTNKIAFYYISKHFISTKKNACPLSGHKGTGVKSDYLSIDLHPVTINTVSFYSAREGDRDSFYFLVSYNVL